MSICTIVEINELWTEKTGRGEFTVKINIRLWTLEQLLEGPRKIRVNGGASEVVKVLAKNSCILMGRKWWNDSPKLGKNIIINKFACKVSTPVREIRAFSWPFNKCLDWHRSEFSFHGTTSFTSSTYQMAALLLSKAISVQLSDDFLETSFMKAGAIWFSAGWETAVTHQPYRF